MAFWEAVEGEGADGFDDAVLGVAGDAFCFHAGEHFF